MLRTCRLVTREHDATMDAYAFVLGALRDDDYRRLRAYPGSGHARFVVWLVVVTRRLSLDFIRARYGRTRSDDAAARSERDTRRRLEDLVASEIQPEIMADRGDAPDVVLRQSELTERLRRCIAQLSAEDQLLLALRFVDDRPVRDIARTLRLATVFHVYRRLGAALRRLQDLLRGVGVDDAEP